jgi:hypothetical protein
MKARLLARGEPVAPGLVLAQEVRGADGRVALAKGRILSQAEARSVSAMPWSELHAVEMETGDVHEDEAGRRLAAAAAGEGVEVQPMSQGAWPLVARQRGLLELDEARLAQLNAIDDLVVYALPHHYIALEGELLGRAKIVPFVTREENLARAEAIAAGGLLRVKRFLPARTALVLQETIDEGALLRARRAIEEKLRFFGSELISVGRDLPMALSAGAQLVLIAGSRPMDPLDPALRALEGAGARLEKSGVPAHPGTLLWLAYLGEVPIIGAPSCGLFSKATALDLVLPRLLAGERLSREQLAGMGAGGLLTREMAFRFPPYRPTAGRGVLDGE